MELLGMHHLTAISAAIRENRLFYTDVLGMRLVKRSVNQDDVTAYHLFYADAKGTPGTDLTFFDWPVPRERRGTRSIVRTCLRVRDHDTLKWWVQRFDEHGVPHGEVFERDGRLTLRFEDPEGQRLALVDDGGAGDPPTTWDRSPVPNEHQIRGLGPIVISIPTLNWRWIFFASIAVALVGMWLVRGTPESKVASSGRYKFDLPGEPSPERSSPHWDSTY
jgi:glyoxalase family protein